MSHFLVSDPTLFSSLLEFDTELARETLAKGCPYCGHDRLHQSHYRRKPLGIEADHRALFSFRFSYCCAACRKRITCPGAQNPFPWMSEILDLKKEKNFFETRVTEYQTGAALTWD